jgi:hypothetical protein
MRGQPLADPVRASRNRRVLVASLVAIAIAMMLAACSGGDDPSNGAPTACERAVRAAAEVPAASVSPSDLDAAIAVCESVAELAEAAERWPGALDGATVERRATPRCQADPVLALSAVCLEVLATAVPTPAPTPDQSDTLEPPGVISFGTGFDAGAYALSGATARFRTTYPRIAFLAELAAPVGDRELTLVIARRTGDGETVALSRALTVRDRDRAAFGLLVEGLPKDLGSRAGMYVMRLLADGEVVAIGEFELVA